MSGVKADVIEILVYIVKFSDLYPLSHREISTIIRVADDRIIIPLSCFPREAYSIWACLFL
jgi:hypothetical protein